MKHKIVNMYGVDFRIKDKYENERKKITTNIDLENYNFVKDINIKTKIEMSSLYDNLIFLVRTNPEILTQYLKLIKEY